MLPLPACLPIRAGPTFLCPFLPLNTGFDAHKKDEINFRYIGVTERDYEWLTEQLVAVANRCAKNQAIQGCWNEPVVCKLCMSGTSQSSWWLSPTGEIWREGSAACKAASMFLLAVQQWAAREAARGGGSQVRTEISIA